MGKGITMSYRKITVDEKDYEYVVGKIHVKVKGVGVWPKEEVGEITVKKYGCDCGCYSDEDYVYTQEELAVITLENGFEPSHDIRVRPSNIANKIRKTIYQRNNK